MFAKFLHNTIFASRSRGVRAPMWCAALAALAALTPPAAHAATTELYSESFDTAGQGSRWELSGDWRFRENSPCLPSTIGYLSPFTALVFDYGTTCAYGNNRFGYATMLTDVTLPITNPSVKLQWSDFVGAELGGDFYFVELSTDGGLTWPYELLRDSADKKFWGPESIDLEPFIGKSIRVRFGFQSDATITGLGWYIDDVKIVAEGLPDGVSALALGDAQVAEGDSGETIINFPLTISPPNAAPITIDHTTQSGTAISGLDFLGSSGLVQIPAADAATLLLQSYTVDLPVKVRGDVITEANETFKVVISSPSANAAITHDTGTGTIIDDEKLTCLLTENFETPVFAWNTGYPSVTISPEPTQIGLWHIEDDSACLTNEDGFTSAHNALVFNNEGTCTYDTSAGVTGYARMMSGILIPDGSIDVDVDALTAQLSFKHHLEIAYNAVQPEVTTAYVEINTNAGIGAWDVLKTYQPDAPSDQNFVIPWSEETINLNDYIGESVMIRFRFVQPDEINPNTATGWYVDDFKICYGARPTTVSKIRIDDNTTTDEGNGATSVMQFNVDIRPANTSDITLSYHTIALNTSDAATPEVDYISTTAQKVIPAGSTSATLDVQIIGDDQPESDESFQIEVTGVTPNVFLVNTAATGTIQDDDSASTFTVGVSGTMAATVNENAGTVVFAAVIDRARSVPITINYETINDTALAGAGLDYVAAKGTITFPPNTTTATFPVTILNDIQFEDANGGTPAQDPEEFKIKLTSNSPYAVGGPDTAIAIVDDEITAPAGVSNLFVDETVTATEGSCANVSSIASCGTLRQAIVTVTLNVANSGDISMQYDTVDGTAIAGQDYVAATGRVEIAKGATSKSFTIDLYADREIEGDEAFNVVLSDPKDIDPVTSLPSTTGSVNVKTNTCIVTIRDDDFNGLAFGINGDRVRTRPLDSPDFAPYVNSPLSGGPLQLTDADFKGFEFDKLYGWQGTNLETIDLVANAATAKALTGASLAGGAVMSGLKWDHTNGIMYACSTDGKLFSVDLNLTTATVSLLATAPGGVKPVALAIHPTTGRIYVISVEGAVARLYKVIRGEWTFALVGDLSDLTPGNASKDAFWSADFDDATFDLYLNAYVAGDIFVTKRVDITNAETKSLLENPAVSALAIASPPAPPSVEWTSDLAYEDKAPKGYNLNGGTAYNGFANGSAVAGIGDINGDTFDDFAITARDADVTDGAATILRAGTVFIVYGSPEGGASEIIDTYKNKDVDFPALLTGDTGAVINGAAANEHAGVSVAGLGDVNGDGIADFAIGYEGGNGAGGVYLVYGSRLMPAAIKTNEIGGTVGGVNITGAAAGDAAGASVAAAGDINTDGLYDLIIGAPNTGVGPAVGRGSAYVIYGSSSGIGSSGTLSLGALSATKGLLITGELTLDAFGTSVGGLGDVNGDGVDDFSISAPGAMPSDVGAVYVIYGHIDYGVDSLVSRIDLVRLDTPTPAQLSPGSPPNLSFTSTMPDTSNLTLFLNPQVPQPGMPGVVPGMRITGQGGQFGTVVKGVGDFNGDAIPDFIISAPTFNGAAVGEPHWGRLYLMYGREGNAPETAATNVGGTIPGVILKGVDNTDLPGVAAGAGDLDGDGLSDLIIGAKDASPGAFDGECYVLYGNASLTGTLSLRDLASTDVDNQIGTYLYNTAGAAGYNFGVAVAGAGDFNDDGITDIIAGHDNGASVLLGSQESVSATYKNRMRAGKSSLAQAVGSSALDLTIKSKVGMWGNGAQYRPLSRVGLAFKGGGTGSQGTLPSTQEITLFREGAPDLDVGNNTARDNASWTPGQVFWKVMTDRSDFTESTIEFFYRPEEIEGFDLQKVKMYYAKPDHAPTKNTTWTLLPLASDPDRGCFIVHRTHIASAAQADVNGYYALVQADFVINLGEQIPSVGITNDQVYADGPTVVPSGFTYWHKSTKRLFAVKPGPVSITWKDEQANPVSTVSALLIWPTDVTRYQPYVSGSPAVKLKNDANAINLQSWQLQATDDVVVKAADAGGSPLTEIASRQQFWAELTRNSNVSDTNGTDDPSLTGRALIMMSDNVDASLGNLYFQFVKLVKWNNPAFTAATRNFNIGTYLGAPTDPTFAAKHEEAAGSPYLLFGNVPYAPSSTRYPGFYDRGARTGTIVFVNAVTGSLRNPVVAFYQQGAKLVDSRTNAYALNAQQQAVKMFAWPHFTGQYTPVWPPYDASNTLVIARQDGSREVDPATYGTAIDVYVQNNSATTGFNPNEEHALIRPYGSGQAVFALRSDLNVNSAGAFVHSQPYVLMTYNDPNDLDTNGDPRAKMRAFYVVAASGKFDFDGWTATASEPPSPYNGVAGSLILPPYPLSTLAVSKKNYTDITVNGTLAWQDRNSSFWATAAGSIPMHYFYPMLSDFYIPAAYQAKYGTTQFTAGGTNDIPWLDGGVLAGAGTTPQTVTYVTTWPANPPVMNIGEVLLEARNGLPQINGQCSVDLIYQESLHAPTPGASAGLIDPVKARSVDLAKVPLGVEVAPNGADLSFPGLPPALSYRISYNEGTKKLTCKGIIVDPVTGFDYLLINVLSPADIATLKNLSSDSDWQAAATALGTACNDVISIANSATQDFDALALSTGNAGGTGYVTLSFQNANKCAPLPVSLAVIKVVGTVNPGALSIVKPACVFDEKLGVMQQIDFGGHPENFYFEWLTTPVIDGLPPTTLPDSDPDNMTDGWFRPDLGLNNPNKGNGVNQITISGPGLLTLTDNWFVCRYKHKNGNAPYGPNYSDWTAPQLAPGWIKRIVGQINPFTQRAGGGGIAGAEAQFAAFSDSAPNNITNMLSLAGARYVGAVPLNCDIIDQFGLIPIYGTVLNRGAALSIDALSPVQTEGVFQALMLAASRLNDLYMLEGNEAYADASDPTIAFGTADGEFGAQAASIHAFDNETSSLLEEELALLRGRDNFYAQGVKTYPVYNRLYWNFTKDFTGGEVAYALNYNIQDAGSGGDGVISEADAARLYPQGHGDAWGHYLTATTTYYRLLRHPFFSWVSRAEGYLIGGTAVTVDYMDERKFAKAAAAKARTGAEIVNLTYREGYVENPASQWQALTDTNTDRAWGFSDWAERAGQGAYIDWVVANAIIPAIDPDPAHSGVTKIDRTTVAELDQIRSSYDQIQIQNDNADLGLNPLGLGTNVVPFDISPTDIDDGLTHFQQIYARALAAMGNAVTAFNSAAGSTQLLRHQADSAVDFQRSVQDTEIDFNSRLIELFGTPYPNDIGPGGTYPKDYTGPDIFHYMYVENNGLYTDQAVRNVFFAPTASNRNSQSLGTTAEALLAANSTVGTGALQMRGYFKNYGGLFDADGVGTDGRPLRPSATGVYTSTAVPVNFNLALNDRGQLSIQKPAAWSNPRASMGELQLSQGEVVQATIGLMTALKEYDNYVKDIQIDADVLASKFGVALDKLELRDDRRDEKILFQQLIFAFKTTQIAIARGISIAEKIAEATAEAVPTVTGIIIGFSNGVIIDGLAPVRGALKGAGAVAAEVLKVVSDLLEITNMQLELQDQLAENKLEIDLEELDAKQEAYESLKELERKINGEITQRLAVYEAHEGLLQAIGNYSKTLGDAQRTLEQLDIFRKRTSADTQLNRYRDMAFRIFRDDQLQKYRAQFDLASRYTYLAAKAYDFETTMLSSDPKSGQRFLTDIVRERELGNVLDGAPQPGIGLAGSMAVMERNFDVLSGQLGFNNPQTETNRFSLRYEKFRQVLGPDGDEAWRTVLNGDYFANGVGRVANLWDVPEYRQYCVPAGDDGTPQPGLIIPFATTIKEGKNFFGNDAGGFDNSYDPTQFATKIRSVGIWFSNYNFTNLSNTPRVYLIPAGQDVLRSPTGAAGTQRYFKILDQILPVPFPITQNDLDDPQWIPMLDGLDGQLTAIRRYGRLRAYHDSGEFDPAEAIADSRLVGRSVWNTRWMLIIPGSTFSSNATEGLDTFINGNLVGGVRDLNGVKDIKVFFETYAYPRLKGAEGGKDPKAVTEAVEVKADVKP